MHFVHETSACATYRDAMASGRTLMIGSEPVRLDGLSLCSLDMGAREDDWYASTWARSA